VKARRAARDIQLLQIEKERAVPMSRRVLQRYYFVQWQRWLDQLKHERVLNEQKQQTWQKVDSWLGQLRAVRIATLAFLRHLSFALIVCLVLCSGAQKAPRLNAIRLCAGSHGGCIACADGCRTGRCALGRAVSCTGFADLRHRRRYTPTGRTIEYDCVGRSSVCCESTEIDSDVTASSNRGCRYRAISCE
jgi:hypothetical protein